MLIRSLLALCALASGSALFAQSAVKINEVLASNVSYVAGDGEITDWLELHNTSNLSVNLEGMRLTDTPLRSSRWVIPAGVSIPPNGFLRIALDSEKPASFEAGPNLNAGFSIKSSGGGIYFYGLGFDELLDSVVFGLQVPDFSVGLVGGVWKLCVPTPGAGNTERATGSAASLRVNEWFANPPAGEDDWFELFNTGSAPVDLSGLYLTDVLAEKTKSQIPALSFIGFGQDGFVKFVADGNFQNGADHVAFSLRAAGEALGIFDGLGNRLDGITFGAQQVDVSEGRLPDGSAFVTTFALTGSPGRANYKLIPNLVVNELLSHTDPPLMDAVEFYNSSDAPINIGGWYLSNKETDLRRYKIPAGTTVPAKGYAVLYESAFNNISTALVPFTFNAAHGDQVYLAEADAEDRLTGYRIGEEFEAAANAVSFGRVETSVAGDYKFVALERHTFGVPNPSTLDDFDNGAGAPNAAPRIGPIVINEIHYNPKREDAFDNTDDEFIELHNVSNQTVQLYDPLNPANRWRLENGVSFVFPSNRSIPAGGYALIVSFNPVLEAAKANLFRQKWGVPGSVSLLGPMLEPLDNDENSIELTWPDLPQPVGRPDAGFVPYIRADKVNHTDRAPWYPDTDASPTLGYSLQKKNSRTFGNDPANWVGALPTPGRANLVADTDGDTITDDWEDLYGFDKTNAADATLDTDSDGFTNVQEFRAGTHPRQAASRLEITAIVPAVSETVGLKLSFIAMADRSYSVIYRNSFAINSVWQKLADILPGAERTVTVEDLGAFARTDRYYQIVTPRID